MCTGRCLSRQWNTKTLGSKRTSRENAHAHTRTHAHDLTYASHNPICKVHVKWKNEEKSWGETKAIVRIKPVQQNTPFTFQCCAEHSVLSANGKHDQSKCTPIVGIYTYIYGIHTCASSHLLLLDRYVRYIFWLIRLINSLKRTGPMPTATCTSLESTYVYTPSTRQNNPIKRIDRNSVLSAYRWFCARSAGLQIRLGDRAAHTIIVVRSAPSNLSDDYGFWFVASTTIMTVPWLRYDRFLLFHCYPLCRVRCFGLFCVRVQLILSFYHHLSYIVLCVSFRFGSFGQS